MDSTKTHFGQWILHRPILGIGFDKDTFWAVDCHRPILGREFYTYPFWPVDSRKNHFGQWIPQKPILGSGFHKDPFWTVDSTLCQEQQQQVVRTSGASTATSSSSPSSNSSRLISFDDFLFTLFKGQVIKIFFSSDSSRLKVRVELINCIFENIT